MDLTTSLLNFMNQSPSTPIDNQGNLINFTNQADSITQRPPIADNSQANSQLDNLATAYSGNNTRLYSPSQSQPYQAPTQTQPIIASNPKVVQATQNLQNFINQNQYAGRLNANPKAVIQPATSNQSASPQMLEYIKKYFPPNQWANAVAVMNAESGGNPKAVGDNYPINGLLAPSYGAFQIRGLPGRPVPTQLLDPEFNVRYAAQMQAEQGWGPWSTAKKLGLL